MSGNEHLSHHRPIVRGDTLAPAASGLYGTSGAERHTTPNPGATWYNLWNDRTALLEHDPPHESSGSLTLVTWLPGCAPHGRAACGHHRVIVPDGVADTIERSGCGNSRINGVSDDEFWRFPRRRVCGTRSRAKTRGSRATRDKGQARQRRNLDSHALSTSAIRAIPKRSRA